MLLSCPKHKSWESDMYEQLNWCTYISVPSNPSSDIICRGMTQDEVAVREGGVLDPLVDLQPFEKWLSNRLECLSVDPDVYTSYCASMLEEGGEDVWEYVSEVISAAMPEDNAEKGDLSGFRSELELRWLRRTQKLAADKEAKEKQAHDLLEIERKLKKQELQEIQSKRTEAAMQKEKNLSKADRQQRNRILDSYGFELGDMDEDGNVIEGNMPKASDGDATLEANLGTNSNKSRVLEMEKQQRKASKDAHRAKVLRDKQTWEKDRAMKEAAKKRSVKQERKPRG